MSNKILAPIVLFVYNRLWHTQQTVESLKKNKFAEESMLCIYSDGPKNESDVEKVSDVRKYLKSITGFKSITIIDRDANLGLSQSIISGVTEIVNKYDTIIVLEDDLIISPHFLEFMNNALEKYKNDDRVLNIHGYLFPIKGKIPVNFFLVYGGCWGWATWKRSWDLFESDGEKLLRQIEKMKLIKRFNLNNKFPFYQMLKDQVAGRNDSWAIRWHATALINNKLTLFPGSSLVDNKGFDGSGSHCEQNDIFFIDLSDDGIPLIDIPVKENKYLARKFQKYLKNMQITS